MLPYAVSLLQVGSEVRRIRENLDTAGFEAAGIFVQAIDQWWMDPKGCPPHNPFAPSKCESQSRRVSAYPVTVAALGRNSHPIPTILRSQGSPIPVRQHVRSALPQCSPGYD